VNKNQQLQQDMIQVKEAVQKALDHAKKQGVDQAEVSMSRSQGLSVSTRNTELETVEFNQDGALGISVYANGCKGSASTSDLSETSIAQTVEAACSIAKFTESDPCHGLADAERMASAVRDLDLCHPEDTPPKQLEALAVRAEQAALDAGASMSDGASANAHFGFKVYGNTHGFLEGYSNSSYSFSAVAIAKQGQNMQRDYDYSQSRIFSKLSDPETIGRMASQKAQARLNGRKLATQSLPVIFHRDVAPSLFAHFITAISGGSLYRKSSFLLDHLGQPIFPKDLRIEENPWLPQGMASAPFDSEGVATEPRIIVDSGKLETYLLTSYSAKKMGMASTGHAGGIYNWKVSNSGLSHQEMLQQMGTGLLVTDMMGQGANTVTGDYSRGAAGFYVENGEIQYPVEGITIAGHLKTMFQNIVAIDNEPDPRSSLSTGAIWIKEMKIAGEAA
jgi:PmbA protein